MAGASGTVAMTETYGFVASSACCGGVMRVWEWNMMATVRFDGYLNKT